MVEALTIVFEGVDRVGKSTVIEGVKGSLKCGYAHFIRQPGETFIGNDIRMTLLDNIKDMCRETQDSLFYADLCQTYHEYEDVFSDPAKVVISDRSWLTGVVYGETDGVNMDDYITKCLKITGVPDLVVLLRINAHTIVRRFSAGATDGIEDVTLDIMIERQKTYIDVLNRMNISYVVVDGGGSEEDVLLEVLGCLEAKFDIA